MWREDGERWAAFWLAGDRLVAALTVDRPRDLVQARRLMERGATVDADRLADPAVAGQGGGRLAAVPGRPNCRAHGRLAGLTDLDFVETLVPAWLTAARGRATCWASASTGSASWSPTASCWPCAAARATR